MLSCFICSKEFDPAMSPERNDPGAVPYAGTIFTSYGNYGSTAFDEMGRSFLRIHICDICLMAPERRNRILEVFSIPNTKYLYTEWKPDKLSGNQIT